MSTDQELFASAMSDEAPPVETVVTTDQTTEAPAPEAGDRPRDEHGRFAPKVQEQDQGQPQAEVPPQQAQQQPTDQPKGDNGGGMIPAWRMAEVTQERNREREEKAALAQQLQALQTQMRQLQEGSKAAPQPAPDMFNDPEGYTAHLTQTFDQRMRNVEANFSLRLAHMKHGDKFEKAFAAAEQAISNGDHQTKQVIANSPDPGEALMRWYGQRSVYDATNGDLDAWFAKRQDEWLKDPANQAKVIEMARASAGNGGQPNGRPGNNIQMPPSLSRIPAASGGGDTDDNSDAALFRHAMRR